MTSRNSYLNKKEREELVFLYKMINFTKNEIQKKIDKINVLFFKDLDNKLLDNFKFNKHFIIDYIFIGNLNSLKEFKKKMILKIIKFLL